MRQVLRQLVGRTLKPYLENHYLKSRRMVTYRGLQLVVEPGVFHPGLFFSSRYLADFLGKQALRGRDFLEIGCGAGLISLVAARNGARVSCVDISARAVRNTRLNARLNRLEISAVVSDLMESVEPAAFDIIAVNPPYYPRAAATEADYAWYCGQEHEYFARLFGQVGAVMHEHSKIYMVLSEHCDLDRIFDFAVKAGFTHCILDEKSFLIEKNFIVAYRKSV